MTTNLASQTPPPAAPASLPSGARRVVAAILIADALLAFAPVIVLGSAIGWPASLSLPAAQQLALIGEHPGAVAAGYGLYLLYSLLIAPAMIGLAALAFGGLHRPFAATVAAFAALSALARAIGILRWLTVMPALANAHAVATPAERVPIELVFTAITRYGGGIGEVLGVSLLMAAAVGALAIGALRERRLPRGLAVSGVVVALLLAALALPTLRLPGVVPVALAVSALSVWMFACGAWALRHERG
ncbi:MAG: DUF4386 family protein [Pseudomonadota bacterium]|jgi:hypothetical protein